MTEEKEKELADFAQELSNKTAEEIFEFIRSRLTVNGERKRFNMSGYDIGSVGSCTVETQSIVNLFADLGIYNYTTFLFLDFYKGTPTIYYKYWGDKQYSSITLDGHSTASIIYEIFCLTIFSDKKTRRR